MNITGLLIFLAIGAVSGWLAGLIMRGGGLGLLGDIVVGIVGAVIGGHLFAFLGVSAGAGLAGSIVTATAGAVVLLWVIRLIKRV
jgi:uncharacterized membrane protein YeaQ/YmgE (transglycosylase-associated protein family)